MTASPENRARAESFGARAEQYDRARPDYPAALFDALLADGATSVLDVGCGTGKAARSYLERGCSVLGVEVDARMAAVARRHGVEVDVARFEDWDARGRTFDLASCAQAWHWIDGERGFAKLAAVVRPGGRAAYFWNLMVVDDALRPALDAVYRERAPELAGETGLMRSEHRAPPLAHGFDDWPEWFAVEPPQAFDRSIRYPTATWLDQLVTHSDHATFDAERLATLLDGLRAVIDDHGGEVPVVMRTVVASAIRR